MSFPLFKDISKNANDLLKKGYTTPEKYSFRTEFDTTSSSGTQLTTHLQRTLDNTIEGELKSKCSCKDFQITSTENSKQDVSFEFAAPKHSTRGIKWAIHLSTNMGDFLEKLKGKFTGEHKGDFSNSSIVFETPIKQGSSQKGDEPKVTFNSVFGSKENGFSLGVDTEFSVSSQAFKTLNTAFACHKKDIEFSLFAKKKIGGGLTTGANYFQKVESSKWNDLQVGAEVAYDLNDKTTNFILATSFKPAEFSSIKARFDNKGLLGFLYTEKWNGPLSVSFGADWNTNNAANPFQHSIKLAFK